MVVFDPPDFDADFSLVGVVLRVGERILLLRRSQEEDYSGFWGLPAGGVEDGESLKEAMVRELAEETGMLLSTAELSFVHDFAVRYPEFDFSYTVFCASSDVVPELVLDPSEHDAFVWVSLDEVLGMHLIPGERECLEEYLDVITNK